MMEVLYPSKPHGSNTPVIIPKTDFVLFETDMIKNTNIPIFQKISAINQLNDSFVYLQYALKDNFQTVEDLISANYYHKPQISKLIQSILNLIKVCDAYLLDIQRVDFSPRVIYFSDVLSDYIWRYIPAQNFEQKYTLLDLIRHVVIESQECAAIISLDNLSTRLFSIEHFYDCLVKMEPPISHTKKWQKFFCKTKIHSTDDSPKSTTSQSKIYPMLLSKANPSESYKLYFELNTIGRDESSNIFIDSHSISRKHAVIYKDNYHFKLKDLKSTNGTFLNGKGVGDEMILANGDYILMGEKEFIFIR